MIWRPFKYIRELEAELSRTRDNAQSYMDAMFAKHKQINDLVELVEAHKTAAEIYRVAFEEFKSKVGA